jgi:light-harvesting complex 1 beta chain
MTDMTMEPSPELTKSDSIAFNGIFVVSFVALLVIALFAQLLTWKWRLWLPGAEGEKSLIHGVKSAVYTFMSYLT